MSTGAQATAFSLASACRRDPQLRAVLRLVRDGSNDAWPILEAIADDVVHPRVAELADEGADFSSFADDDE